MSLAHKFRFYFSFRSPFAGIAFYRLRRSALFKDFAIEVIPVWPENIFGGHMDNPTDNLFKLAYVFADAARQAEDAGLSATFLRNVAKNIELPKDVDYSKEKVGLNMPPEPWGITHHAFLYAQEQGKGWEFGDAVFARRFDFDGKGSRDVMDPEVLGVIASQVGLDVADVQNAYTSGRYGEAQAELTTMSETDGVFGVPFFTFDRGVGRESFWGNDRLPDLYKTMTGADAAPSITADNLTEVQPARK
jgi:2-hydroxychromene-2-carboxylate isomerase